MATEEDEQDTYVAQLKEVFDSCDGSQMGFLNQQELVELCTKLQLEEQSDALVKLLMGHDGRARVGFEEFKEGFVSVLSETVDGLESTDEDIDEDEEQEDQDDEFEDPDDKRGPHKFTAEISPKLIRGDKRYGRRSRPTTDTEDDEEYGLLSIKSTPRGQRPLIDRENSFVKV